MPELATVMRDAGRVHLDGLLAEVTGLQVGIWHVIHGEMLGQPVFPVD